MELNATLKSAGTVWGVESTDGCQKGYRREDWSAEERRARRKIYLRRSMGHPLYDSNLLVSSGESER